MGVYVRTYVATTVSEEKQYNARSVFLFLK